MLDPLLFVDGQQAMDSEGYVPLTIFAGMPGMIQCVLLAVLQLIWIAQGIICDIKMIPAVAVNVLVLPLRESKLAEQVSRARKGKSAVLLYLVSSSAPLAIFTSNPVLTRDPPEDAPMNDRPRSWLASWTQEDLLAWDAQRIAQQAEQIGITQNMATEAPTPPLSAAGSRCQRVAPNFHGTGLRSTRASASRQQGAHCLRLQKRRAYATFVISL
ncbi:hypothetical protein DFH08DRAFT_805038 [Mycena albidolilacea]|uniref:Uncharacterized protein n=1 Tax=Mycena albidolilacea TaxID=1033008 RepID=A0AAD7AAM9_9AGAR|nr:hypothetical protein DFH08DRAFT_805038 [Mycena albidolilacea]